MVAGKSTLGVARIVAAHGIRGGVRAQLFDAGSESLEVGREVHLGEGGPLTTVVELSRVPGKDSLRLRFAGIVNRDQAEALRGVELHVDRDLLPPLAEDEFYLDDAIGLAVERRRDGGATQPLGVVVGLTSNGVQDLFEVEWVAPDGQRHEWLLPVLPQFIEELDEVRILVTPPIGLLPAALEPEEAP
ncbi:MAG TPA: ribosome maturation factor RimM [Nannocystaceae bacterium]|nr:ribosome maturation factor RimM [Nannocystaceae bacterium]